MWRVEHEAERGTFYQCTCDYRTLSVKSKSEVFPLPRIDDLSGQIWRRTCHFSEEGVQHVFWTVERRRQYEHMTITYKGQYFPTD